MKARSIRAGSNPARSRAAEVGVLTICQSGFHFRQFLTWCVDYFAKVCFTFVSFKLVVLTILSNCDSLLAVFNLVC